MDRHITSSEHHISSNKYLLAVTQWKFVCIIYLLFANHLAMAILDGFYEHIYYYIVKLVQADLFSSESRYWIKYIETP